MFSLLLFLQIKFLQVVVSYCFPVGAARIFGDYIVFIMTFFYRHEIENIQYDLKKLASFKEKHVMTPYSKGWPSFMNLLNLLAVNLI